MGAAPTVELLARCRQVPPLKRLKLGVTGVLVAALYANVIPAMATVWWNDPGYSHGLLIPPLALYIAWIHRDELLACHARQDGRGLWLTGLACLLYLAGTLGAEFFLARLSIVVMLAGLIWTFWGPERLRVLTFPLVLLATMVPLPAIVYNRLAVPLQLFSSALATDILHLLQVPVFRDGNIIHLANQSLNVAEACSGLRSISSLSVLALVIGYLQSAKLWARVLLFLLAAPVAIAMNVLRIVGTALAARHDPSLAEGFYHSFSGWLVFVVGFAALYLLSLLIQRLAGRPHGAHA